VGADGLQAAGPDGLLRSLVVESGARGRGLGAALVGALENRAAARGVVRLYLLTTTAAEFFERLGYEPVARDSVPPGIAATAEFRTLCPASATCLCRSLGD
jgi:amino-acid N-acetyltransferase